MFEEEEQKGPKKRRKTGLAQVDRESKCADCHDCPLWPITSCRPHVIGHRARVPCQSKGTGSWDARSPGA